MEYSHINGLHNNDTQKDIKCNNASELSVVKIDQIVIFLLLTLNYSTPVQHLTWGAVT